MLEKVCHIGPGFAVQGGISSVLVSYKKLFNLSKTNFISSYNGSFLKSIPLLLKTCFKILFKKNHNFEIFSSFLYFIPNFHAPTRDKRKNKTKK